MIARAFIISGLMLFFCPAAKAQTLTEVRQMSFGTFAVAANDVSSGITITPENDVFADAGILTDGGAQRGEYRLENFPPNVSFFLGVDVPNPPTEGGVVLDNIVAATNGVGPSFYLSDLAISNGGVLQTDGQGDAMLYIGGTLRTSGTGERYNSGTYSGSYSITIHY